MKLQGERQSFGPGFGLAADGPTLVRIQDRLQALANDGVVVSDEDADREGNGLDSLLQFAAKGES